MYKFTNFKGVDTDERFRFTGAMCVKLKPIPVDRPWRDATGGFGAYAPIGMWCELRDKSGYSSGGFVSASFERNIIPAVLCGEDRSYDEWYEDLYWRLRNFGFQSGEIVDLAQLELMMLDIMAKRRGLPLHRLLGATKDYALCYKGGGSLLASDDELVGEMATYAGQGYRTVKFKVGSDWGRDMEADARRLMKVREALGDEFEIAVDCNQVFDAGEAVEFWNMIKEFRPAWFEEPVHSHDMNAIAYVAQHTDAVVAAGESMRNAFAFETYVEKGVRHLMPLVGRMSRMSDLVRIRDMARKNHLRFSSGGNVWLNAAFGAAFYEEGEFLENHEPMTMPIGQCLSVKPEERNGRMYLSDIPGSPIRLDREGLERRGLIDDIKFYGVDKAGGFYVRVTY